MATEFKKVNIVINRIGISFLKLYFKYKYSITYDNRDLNNVEPPYLILPNHVNNLDPFFVGAFVKEPIYFVTSDEQFRNPVKGFLLSKLTGAIPKKKFVPDIITVKDIIRIVKNKGIVGIFPEGQRNWDGETQELVRSTAKLIKMLEIPVVTVILSGSHLAHPRWANNNRKGKVHLKYEYTFTPEDIKNMSADEIDKELSDKLNYDEYEQQKKVMNTYTAHNLAESLELFLFTCPQCKSIGTMQSKGNVFYCNKCNYTVIYNKYGFFDKITDEPLFTYPNPWNKWQIGNLIQLIEKEEDTDHIILRDDKVTVSVGSSLKPLINMYYGTIFLNKIYLYIENLDNQIIPFEVSKMLGLNVQYNDQFEFYYNEQLFRFRFDNTTISAYKWTEALNFLHGK
ncbi:MAG: 1-acyl-sn-glycerol-3-phosphate acyltransferase [Vulcanibacillus sp.]